LLVSVGYVWGGSGTVPFLGVPFLGQVAPGRAPQGAHQGIKNKRLRGTYKGQDWLAWVLPSGRIKRKHTGDIYDSPSGAAGAIKRRATNGWTFWRYLNDAHEWVPLAALRG
jgi:hypothetical protein